MKARHPQRAERHVQFTEQTESEPDFFVDWEETDPELEDMDARETALLAYGEHTPEE